ncbi:MAG: DUF4886 domain-containing protein [Ruminococcaceae bacterium]|nr:DUF4886 domain-containing protein [Oscillospiraceae bacterium]
MKRLLACLLSMVMVITSFASVSFIEAFAADEYVQPQGNHTTVLSEVDIDSATFNTNAAGTSLSSIKYTTSGSVANSSISSGVWNSRSKGTATDTDGSVFSNSMSGSVVNTGDMSADQYPDIKESGNIPVWKINQNGAVTVTRFQDMAGSAGWGFETGDKFLFTIKLYLGDIKSKAAYTDADGNAVAAVADTTTKYIDTKSFVRRQSNSSTTLADTDEQTHYVPVNKWFTLTRVITVTEALLSKYNIMEGVGFTFKNSGGTAASYSKPFPATVFVGEVKVEKFEDTSLTRNTNLINYYDDYEDLIISDMATENETYSGTYGTTTLLKDSLDRFNYKNIAVNDSGNVKTVQTGAYTDGSAFTYAKSSDIGVITPFGQGIKGAGVYAASEDSVIETTYPSAKSMYDIAQGVEGAAEVTTLTPKAHTGTKSFAFSRMLLSNSALRINGIFGFHPVEADKDRTFKISFWVYPDSTQGAHKNELLNDATGDTATYEDVTPVAPESGTPKLQVHMNGPVGQWYKYRNSSTTACRVWSQNIPWDTWTKVEFEYTIGNFYDNGDTDTSADTNPLKNCLQIDQGNKSCVADTIYYDDFSIQEIVRHNISAVSSDEAMGEVTGGGKYDDGASVTLTATPKEGFTFTGWYNGDTLVSEEASYTFNATESITLTAKFKAPSSYTVTVSSDDTAKGTVEGSGTYYEGGTVSVIATPKDGYMLDGWYNGDTLLSKKLTYTFKARDNVSLTAKFVTEVSDGYGTIGFIGNEDGDTPTGTINGFGSTSVKNTNFENEITTYEAVGDVPPSELITGEEFGEGVFDFDAETIANVANGTETWEGPLYGRFPHIAPANMPLTSNKIRISMWVKYVDSKNDVDDTATFGFKWTTTESPTSNTNIDNTGNPYATSPDFTLRKGEWTKITHSFDLTPDDLVGKYGIRFFTKNTDTDAPTRFLLDNIRFENYMEVTEPFFTLDCANKNIVAEAMFKRDDLIGKKYNFYIATYDDQGKMTDLKISEDYVVKQNFNYETFETPMTDENQRVSAFLWAEGEMPLFGAQTMKIDTIKILGIGNSFSVDSMQYLYPLLKEAGYENVILGNAYIGGCSLETHWGNVEGDKAAYTYYQNDSGVWTSTKEAKLFEMIVDQDWDVITLQQNSRNSGNLDTYEDYLTNMINWVNENKLNKDAKIFWHMTWAYQEGYGGLSSYDNSQMTMYNSIISAVNAKVVPHNEFTAIIPVGTVIQNMRTSFLGDTLNRDGTHLNIDYGRLAAGLMWVKVITGADITDFTYNPNPYAITDEIMLVAKEAVNNAFNTPFAVTDSIYPPEETEEPETPEVPELDQTGVPSGYYRINPEMLENSFYNSKSGHTNRTTTGTTAPKYVSSKLFTKADLPNGTIIEIADGWQYRPEGWITATTKNDDSTRPGNVTTPQVTVDDAWWGDFTIRAFNVCSNPSADITSRFDEAKDALRIYVPIS